MRALYWLVVLLHVALVWWLPVFPTQDGPTHIYSTLILRDLLNGGALYGDFVDLRLSFVPNLGATVPLYALLAVLPPMLAEKAFISLVFLLVAGVMPRLARMAGGHPYPASFLVFPLLGSGLTMFGFYSLMVGQALWLWSIWLFWRVAGKPLWHRWLVTTSCALVLFAAHFMAFGCYVLAILCAALGSGGRAGRWRAQLGSLAVLLSVPMLLTAWYLRVLVASSGSTQTLDRPPLRWWSGFNLQQDLRGLFDVAMWNQVCLSLDQVWTGSLLLAITAWLLYRRGTRPSWSSMEPHGSGTTGCALAARRGLGLLAVLLILLMCVVPDGIGELSLIKYRFPALVALLLPAILSCARYGAGLRVIVVAVALTAASLNAVLIHRNALRLHAFLVAAPLPAVRGQFVASYRPHPPEVPVDTLGHAASYYCVMLGCLDAQNYQAHSRQFFVRFKPSPALAAWPLLAKTQTRVDWGRFPRQVAYVIGWDLFPAERARIEEHFALVRQSGLVTIWQRRPVIVSDPGVAYARPVSPSQEVRR